jgi:hypothetical protein
MQLHVDFKGTADSDTRVHRGAAVMMFVCGESGVKWDESSMTRAQLLSSTKRQVELCRGIILFISI